jgi:hypothetical protein
MNATEIIERLGGVTKTAALCEVTAQAVSQWHTNGIPKARLKYLRLARPDVFEQVDAQKSSSESQPQ